MEIQWVILAQAYRLNLNRTIDIWGIFHHATMHDRNNEISPWLLAKVNIKPTEAGENKGIILEIIHSRHGKLATFNATYKMPDLISWAQDIPYIAMLLDKVDLPYSGEYTFRLSVDGNSNEETIGVTYLKEGGDA